MANKIIFQRKKNGWSQEELAKMIQVSPETVDRWEEGFSLPNLNHILELSALFGVPTDYLLKDEPLNRKSPGTWKLPVQWVTLEEAKEFLMLRNEASHRIALGVFLLILAPVILILLNSAVKLRGFPTDEVTGQVLAMVFALLPVAIASAILLDVERDSSPYKFLENERFKTEEGVEKMVHQRRDGFSKTYYRNNFLGTVFCILSLIPLFLSSPMMSNFFDVVMLCLTLILAGIGVISFILVGVPWESMNKLLQKGGYRVRRKKENLVQGHIARMYWLIATAIYLGWSLSTTDWPITWIVWLVAGILYIPLYILFGMVLEKRIEENHL